MFSSHMLWANQSPVVIKRVTEPINFDGKIIDAMWAEIDPVELTTFSPVYQASAINKTEIKLCYNVSALLSTYCLGNQVALP